MLGRLCFVLVSILYEENYDEALKESFEFEVKLLRNSVFERAGIFDKLLSDFDGGETYLKSLCCF